MLAFAYTQEPVELTLAAERRKPQVTVRQLLGGPGRGGRGQVPIHASSTTSSTAA